MGISVKVSAFYFAVSAFCLSIVVCAPSGEQYTNPSSSSARGSSGGQDDGEDDGYGQPSGFRGGRYYFGGIYRGSCYNDGLYYMDETNFVICSNGNAYIQPCAPGTKSSGQHRYSPGYYYGYSDFCDVNLVDMGYGPAHYAPYGVSAYNNLNAPGYAYSYERQDAPSDPPARPQGYGGSSTGGDTNRGDGGRYGGGYGDRKESYAVKSQSGSNQGGH